MGCSSCQRRVEQVRSQMAENRVRQVASGHLLSGHTLTEFGWVKTCVVCGMKTDPKTYPEECVPKCTCK